VRDIALAFFGMILIREVADAPVITGISKPARPNLRTAQGIRIVAYGLLA
jgi:hypothetical protein